jgi:hypothetical protein
VATSRHAGARARPVWARFRFEALARESQLRGRLTARAAKYIIAERDAADNPQTAELLAQVRAKTIRYVIYTISLIDIVLLNRVPVRWTAPTAIVRRRRGLTRCQALCSHRKRLPVADLGWRTSGPASDLGSSENLFQNAL